MIQMAVPRVLVIEDDEGARNALASLLSDEGYAVSTASGGVEGVSLARSFWPHVVICDYSLPDIDGLEVMRRLRSAGRDYFFIIVTAGRFDHLGERHLRSEADVFLDKPVDLAELRTALVRATSESGSACALN